MPVNIEAAVMSKLSRRFASLSLTSLAALVVSTGCSDQASAPAVPSTPVPKVHVDGKPPAAPVPAVPDVEPPKRPAGLIADILQEKELFKRAQRMADAIATLGPEALPDVKHALKRMDVSTQIVEVVLLARFWALHEPAEATRWALYKAPSGYRSALALPTMTEWARLDPFAAQAEIDAARVVPGAQTAIMEIALIRGWFYSETPGLEDYIRGLGVSPNRQRALRALIRSILNEYGPDHAIRWVESLDGEDRKFKLAGFRQVALELGSTHLDEAMEFCASYCDHPEWGKGLRKQITQQWALQDGESAMEFLKSSPPNAETDQAAQWAFSGWYGNDKTELRAWLDSIGPENVEPWMQPMLELISVDFGRRDPHKGLAWAGAIVKNKDRRRTVTTVVTNWRRRSPEEADAWLEGTSLPEEFKERVRYYGRPQEVVKADPNPGPGRLKRPRMHPKDTELAEFDDTAEDAAEETSE